jgi:hypothetical protein
MPSIKICRTLLTGFYRNHILLCPGFSWEFGEYRWIVFRVFTNMAMRIWGLVRFAYNRIWKYADALVITWTTDYIPWQIQGTGGDPLKVLQRRNFESVICGNEYYPGQNVQRVGVVRKSEKLPTSSPFENEISGEAGGCQVSTLCRMKFRCQGSSYNYRVFERYCTYLW